MAYFKALDRVTCRREKHIRNSWKADYVPAALLELSSLFSHQVCSSVTSVSLNGHLTAETVSKGHKLALFHKICWTFLSTFAVSQEHLPRRCSLLRTVLCTLLTHVFPPLLCSSVSFAGFSTSSISPVGALRRLDGGVLSGSLLVHCLQFHDFIDQS